MNNKVKINLCLTTDEVDDVVAALSTKGNALIALSENIYENASSQYRTIMQMKQEDELKKKSKTSKNKKGEKE